MEAQKTGEVSTNKLSTKIKIEKVAQNDKTEMKGLKINRKRPMPRVETKRTELFTLLTDQPLDIKTPWHLILNHATPAALIQLARSPYMKMPQLNSIRITKDMSCRGCLEGRIKRAPHKRKQHHYDRREAVSPDIMGPLNIDGMP